MVSTSVSSTLCRIDLLGCHSGASWGISHLLHLCRGWYSWMEQKKCELCLVSVFLHLHFNSCRIRIRKVHLRLLLGFAATASPSSWSFASQTELVIFYLLKLSISTAVANPHESLRKEKKPFKSQKLSLTLPEVLWLVGGSMGDAYPNPPCRQLDAWSLSVWPQQLALQSSAYY